MQVFMPAPSEKDSLLQSLKRSGWGVVYVSPEPMPDGFFRVTAVEPLEEEKLRARVDVESYRSELEHCSAAGYADGQTPHDAMEAQHA
jgi:hypothetical protein